MAVCPGDFVRGLYSVLRPDAINKGSMDYHLPNMDI